MTDCYLTVGELKEKLKDVPDDVEVYYQRIEDYYFKYNNWTIEKMIFDCPDDYSEYIEAFSCYLHPDTNKFVINAHY